MRRILVALALLALLLAAPAARAARTLILISLDGTTPAQIADPQLPTLARLAREGARAERLVPVFPTNTFPNHVTFVTGVAPERHGIVSNSFLDPERGLYDYENDPSWILVEPLWSLAARAGVVSAAYHWVGSEGAWTSGLGPRHWKRFDAGVREREKVEQMLAWLDLPDPAERPRLLTSWFHGADHVGHRRGPEGPHVRRALEPQDEALALLVRGLEQRGLWRETTLLVVSDHGMALVARQVDLVGALRAAKIRGRVLGGGGFASIARADAERARDAARALGLGAWRRAEAPPELRVGHARFGDVVVVAPLGTAIARSGLAAGRPGGAHGYRPEEPPMSGIFLAFGAGVPAGLALGAVRAVDVAPTALALLALPIPEWMEGRPVLAAQEERP